MTLLEAVVLGAIQGVTEFLPVSSSGHLVIAQHFIQGFEQPGVLFDVILHVGTLIAVLIYFRHDIVNLVSGFVKKGPEHKRPVLLILAASVPTGIIGIVFKESFEQLFHSVFSVGIMLIITGCILFLAGRVTGNQKKKLGFPDALLIGLSQGIAIIPGISRSGITISTGILRNYDAEEMGRFSFLLSIPAIIGALLLQGSHISALDAGSLMHYFIGALAAFLTGLIAIKLLMSILKLRRLSLFSYYCWAAGIAACLLI